MLINKLTYFLNKYKLVNYILGKKKVTICICIDLCDYVQSAVLWTSGSIKTKIQRYFSQKIR